MVPSNALLRGTNQLLLIIFTCVLAQASSLSSQFLLLMLSSYHFGLLAQVVIYFLEFGSCECKMKLKQNFWIA